MAFATSPESAGEKGEGRIAGGRIAGDGKIDMANSMIEAAALTHRHQFNLGATQHLLKFVQNALISCGDPTIGVIARLVID